MNTEFKVGDRVQRINCHNGDGARVGRTATVVSIANGGNPYVEYPGFLPSPLNPVGELWFRGNTRLLSRPIPRNGEVLVSPLPSECVIQAPKIAPGLQWVELHECARTYHFPDGSKFVVEDAVRLCVRPSGHRLETAAGRKFIVPGKFIAIEIHANDWSA